MKSARVAVLSTFILFAFVISASAQSYYQPVYSQQPVRGERKVAVFVHNDTDGTLNAIFEVNGVRWPVRIMSGNMVPDLLVPASARMKVKSAKTLVFEGNKRTEKAVKYCHYFSEEMRMQGWYFYRGRSTGPCEQ